MDKSNMIFGGDCLAIQNECLEITAFTEGHLPFRYLGIHITASRLTKGECRLFLEKIIAKIRVWASRHISYVGRLVLINTVLFGLFSFWARIFILPQEVVDQVTKVCRNFMWGVGITKKLLMLLGAEYVCPRRMKVCR